MRKYLSGLLAVTSAIGFSAFTLKNVEVPRQTVRYAVFNLVGTTVGEKEFSNYALQNSKPPASQCPGAVFVCWIRITDVNMDGVINQADFTIIVNMLDTNGNGKISDDNTENGTSYEEQI